MAGEYLRRRYGNIVQTRYHDLRDPAVRAQSAAFEAKFSEQQWTLPVVLVDGEVALQGYLDVSSLIVAVAQQLEAPPSEVAPPLLAGERSVEYGLSRGENNPQAPQDRGAGERARADGGRAQSVR